MTAKFVCKTQITRMQSFRGPSGTNYVSIKGRPFEVYVDEDVPYFDDNHRFVRANVLNKLKGEYPEEDKPADEELIEFLTSEAKISEAAAGRVAEKYLSKDELIDHVIDGASLTDRDLLTERQADMVRQAIYDGKED